MGLVAQRWWAWRTGFLPEAWPDACFMSVTNGFSVPEAGALDSWKNAPCRCGHNIPTKNENFGIFNLPLVTGNAQREAVARTSAINNILEYLVPPLGKSAQVVNIGAGFDGRMFSLASLENATLFELDQGDTLELKRSLVYNCGLEAVNGVGVYSLPLNLLDNNNIYHRLLAHPAFNPENPTVFIHESVAEFIDEYSNVQSMRAIAALARRCPDSRMVLNTWRGAISSLPHSPPRPDGQALAFRQPTGEMAAKSAVPYNVLGDPIKFMLPENPRMDLQWFMNAGGWVQALSPELLEIKAEFEQQRIPYSYLNVLKAPRLPQMRGGRPGVDYYY